jgi:hypothetical protein
MTAEDLISGALAKPAFAPAGAAAIAMTVFIHEIRIRSGQNGGIGIRHARGDHQQCARRRSRWSPTIALPGRA